MSIMAHGEPEIEYIQVGCNYERVRVSREEVMKAIPDDILLSMYRNMIRTRALDDKIKQMINRGFRISEHSTLGQEAGPVAACATLEPQDYIMPYHRGWAWALGRNVDPKYLLAELLGKKAGYMKGKGGPHFGCWELGILGRSGVQAAHISISAGIGLGINKKKENKVCLVFFGDGASNNGYFHEGINLAAVWKAPVIYFCENNLYQITCTHEETTACENIGARALGYDIPGYIVDGNDAAGIYYIVREAVARARRGEGPTLIETKTYRWDGHNVMDKAHLGGYRTLEEREEWMKKCPIALLEKELKKISLLTDESAEKIKADAREEMEYAAEFAINAPYPDREDYYTAVYAD